MRRFAALFVFVAASWLVPLGMPGLEATWAIAPAGAEPTTSSGEPAEPLPPAPDDENPRLEPTPAATIEPGAPDEPDDDEGVGTGALIGVGVFVVLAVGISVHLNRTRL